MRCSKLFCMTPLITVIAMVAAQKYENNVTFTDNVWANLGKMTGILLQNCWYWASHYREQDIMLQMQNCLKQRALTALSRMLQGDVIEIYEGVELVRYLDRSGNFSRRSDSNLQQEDLDLESQIISRLADVFETHILKIRLANIANADYDINEARHRNRRNNMMPFMVFGVVAMGMILIPMGFKFLAVLGGKALLLAKMALLLSSIQGLKRVATSNFNYGLYHSPPSNPWYHDRHGYDDIPDEQVDQLHHAYMRS